MNQDLCDDHALAIAAERMVRDHMCVARGENIVITVDTSRDPRAARAVYRASAAAGAKPVMVYMPQLPLQGSLADPHLSEIVVAAVGASDVWFDMTFPYMAGSKAHNAAMENRRTRSLLLADLTAAGLTRLFGYVDLDELFEMQAALDALVAGNVGKQCRVTSENGTDLTFVIAKPATRKSRRVTEAGLYTPPGSAVMYPADDSVVGRAVVEYAYHEFYTRLHEPLTIDIDRHIVGLRGGGADRLPAERAMRRASCGALGSIIHASIGFHPAARLGGHSFIEDIRAIGCNALGLGIPWWKPGGGENHPDVVVPMQSMWIDGKPVVERGCIVAAELAAKDDHLQSAFIPCVR